MIKKVQILKTPGCTSCAKAMVLVKKIKKEEKLSFKIQELDISKHPDLLQKYQIMVSPGIVIDGKLEFVGMPNERKLREKLIK
ncbi:MAG: thioredoxin family protein [Nanoarchaeota archaeon]|nr:thioredoxin family protein [Nanoarchaeota archaeon]